MRDAVETFELAHPRGVTRHFYGVGAISAGAEALDGALRGRAVVAVSAAPIVDLHADALEPLRARAGAFELLTVPASPKQRIDEELDKLAVLEPGSPEYAVTRNWLDVATSVPWGVCSHDNLDLKRARAVLLATPGAPTF